MTIHNYVINSDKIQVISEEKNNKKQFEFMLKNDKLSKITIYYDNGQIQNETCLDDGKIISYKFYQEMNTRYYVDSKLFYEINLDKNNLLKHYKFYNSDTQIITYEGEYVNNKKTGYGKEYYSNGNVSYEGNWVDDSFYGEGINYYENGIIEFNGLYERGKKNGFGTSYFEDGSKKSEENWSNDVRFGNNKIFHKNGHIEMDGYFNDDYFKGLSYRENGLKMYGGEMARDSSDKYFNNGIGDSFHANGVKYYSGQWRNNQYDGFGKLYYENGDIQYNGNFKDNCYDGFGAKHDQCGKLMCIGSWKSGNLENITITNECQLKAHKLIKTDSYITIGAIVNGFISGYTEKYNRYTGLRTYEGFYCERGEKNYGKFKQFDENEDNHQILSYIGNIKGTSWHGYFYQYNWNGKFNRRIMYENGNEVQNKFTVYYNDDGNIDFNQSHKGELYLVGDFEREYM